MTIPDAQAIIDNATRAASPQRLEPGEIATLVVPDGATVQMIDCEKYSEAPRRKTGNFVMFTAESLAEFVNTHMDTGTALYADVEHATVKAVIDEHIGDGTAGWREFTATFRARLTPEWEAWLGTDGKWHNQASFAEFLEDHAADVKDPPAADLLELAKTFEAKTNVQFRSAIRLDSGERQLNFTETIDAQAGRQGQITIPDRVTLGLVPFEGADAYRLDARFRYRLDGGTLRLGVVLDRPDRVLRDAFTEVLAGVAEATGLKPYHGLG